MGVPNVPLRITITPRSETMELALRLLHVATGCSFPLPFVPSRSYKDPQLGFGQGG